MAAARDEPILQPVSPSVLSNVERSVSKLLGSEMLPFQKTYLIAQIKDIYAKVASSPTPKELLVHIPDITSSLDMLRPAVKSLKAGKLQLEAFITNVEKILKLTTTGKLVQKTNTDIEFELEERKKYKEALESELARCTKELESLENTESDIIAEEERVRKRRLEFEDVKRKTLKAMASKFIDIVNRISKDLLSLWPFAPIIR